MANVRIWRFQSPEGDSLFFYHRKHGWLKTLNSIVSVPRRGFVVFLPQRRSSRRYERSERFQSPEGDSLFFYQSITSATSKRARYGFQSPEGDSLFFY